MPCDDEADFHRVALVGAQTLKENDAALPFASKYTEGHEDSRPRRTSAMRLLALARGQDGAISARCSSTIETADEEPVTPGLDLKV